MKFNFLNVILSKFKENQRLSKSVRFGFIMDMNFEEELKKKLKKI